MSWWYSFSLHIKGEWWVFLTNLDPFLWKEDDRFDFLKQLSFAIELRCKSVDFLDPHFSCFDIIYNGVSVSQSKPLITPLYPWNHQRRWHQCKGSSPQSYSKESWRFLLRRKWTRVCDDSLNNWRNRTLKHHWCLHSAQRFNSQTCEWVLHLVHMFFWLFSFISVFANVLRMVAEMCVVEV